MSFLPLRYGKERERTRRATGSAPSQRQRNMNLFIQSTENHCNAMCKIVDYFVILYSEYSLCTQDKFPPGIWTCCMGRWRGK